MRKYRRQVKLNWTLLQVCFFCTCVKYENSRKQYFVIVKYIHYASHWEWVIYHMAVLFVKSHLVISGM